MTSVTIERAIMEDLINYKLKRIQNFISEILIRWKEISATIFLEKSRNGSYEDAENDAIELRQLLSEENKLRIMLQNL